MPMFKVCTSCKETFIAESPAIKLCPVCNAKSQTTPSERAQKNCRIKPDRLMLDVRQADAAGLSYGVWRAREDDKKRKAEEVIRRQIEERKKKHGESKT